MTPRTGATLGLLAFACASPRDHAFFEAHVGQRVELVGRVATTEWQHMTTSVPGKSIVYVDLDSGKHQIVAHFARAPDCRGDFELTGTVFEVRGPSKAARRGEPGAERDEFWEYAVDVASWRCR